MTKKELRQMMREALDKNSGDTGTAVWGLVEALPEFRDASTVLIYMALPDEVPTAEFISRWNGIKKFAIPKVNGEGLDLKLYDAGCLVSGYHGIMEPSEDAGGIRPEDISLALVPGMAFDAEGHRLGRGKGFYDRLLPALHCPTVAICQQWRMVECVPTDPWDRMIDIIPWTSAPATGKL